MFLALISHFDSILGQDYSKEYQYKELQEPQGVPSHWP